MIKILFTRISRFSKISMKPNHFKFYDIAANLTDSQFSGEYYGKQHHPDDREEVINRAR